MCLIAVALHVAPAVPLVVAANRDEWRDRPAAPLAWWTDHPDILAGRDLQAGGTWMGVSRGGRFAAVTNFRDPWGRGANRRSRGELVTSYLVGTEAPRDFLATLAARASEYSGFNLVVGDARELVYFGSREGVVRAIEPGIHALSNHLLDQPWPKVQRARAALSAAPSDEAALFAMLADRTPARDAELPDTGVGLDWERRLSPPLITGSDYGTRASTVLRIRPDGNVHVEERTIDAAGAVVGTSAVAFDVPRARPSGGAASTRR